MDLFDLLSLLGGLSIFLFGMTLMGDALKRAAGSKLSMLLGKLTTNRFFGFLTGLLVTSVIQSSSATTVMVVGFVNSGLMTLRQAINVIMGANVGTTITAWILSIDHLTSGASGFFLKLLKPSSFTPVLALIGIAYLMFAKSNKKKDVGTILLGFATLMFGMDAMSAAVSGLSQSESFRQLFIAFENPILGMLAGAILTAIIQSSSASVGILQALSTTGAVSLGASIPIIMGQNIGTCVTAVLSAAGANRNAKRAAFAHLFFNVLSMLVFLPLFVIAKTWIIDPALLAISTNPIIIAITHTSFKLLYTFLMFPVAGVLEKLAVKLFPNPKVPEKAQELDERLLDTPKVALEVCVDQATAMANEALRSIKDGISALRVYSTELADNVRASEERVDGYEDRIGTYLVKLSSHTLAESESSEAAKLLRLIGDYERISDHSVNLVEAAEELKSKNMALSETAQGELSVLCGAVNEILELSTKAFVNNDFDAANMVEPLEQVIDELKENLRARHIARLQRGECTIEVGFAWSDIITNLERIADHCSNIAACVIDTAHNNMNMHESVKSVRADREDFEQKYHAYKLRYTV